MSHTTIPLDRAGTTAGQRPPGGDGFPTARCASHTHRLSASQNSATDFPPGAGVKLGPRALDGRHAELTLAHGGTTLRWRYAKSDPFILRGGWDTLAFSEWGLRFWVNLCFHSDSGALWRYDPATGLLVSRIGHRHIAVACAAQPLLATFHAALDALKAEFHEHGYFCLASRGVEGRVAALRFNLEEMPSEAGSAIAIADAAVLAARGEARGLGAPEPEALAEQPQALAAVLDVIAWNTVWDPVNRRPYAALSRHWNSRKFGGFGVAERCALSCPTGQPVRRRTGARKSGRGAGGRDAAGQSALSAHRQRCLGGSQPAADRGFHRVDDPFALAFARAAGMGVSHPQARL
ncbi:MAG: hypothetical protein U1F68_07575 [Gammaproteobacteria bacterium]